MSRDSHFDEFQDHTSLKHFLLEAYLKQWATILINGIKRHGKQRPRLWYVDAFAGAGRDSTGTPGSPVIAAEIATKVNIEHFGSAHPAKEEGMRVIATERDPNRFKQLEQNLKPYPIAHPRPGALGSILRPLLEHVGKDPTFFFLDPFGVGGLDAALLPSILRGPRTEILLLFSDEGAVRLAGKATATVPSRERLLASRKAGPSVFGEEFDEELERQERLAVERVLSGHQSNNRALEILNTAFGGERWKEILNTTPAERRREAFVTLYEQVLREAGATHVLQFAVTTGQGRHKYTLMHASKNVRAFAAMKDAMDRTRRKRPAPEASPSLFDISDGGDADVGPLFSPIFANVEAAANHVVRHFAGQTVRWAGEGYSDEAIQHFARDNTPLFKHEYPALRAELEHRGLTVTKPNGKPVSPLSFKFPPL
jgi:three-Cys-motif partner protein